MRNKKYLIIIFLLVLYLGMELFLPLMVENRIKKGIRNHTESVKELEVEVDSFPAWELLFSRADRVKLTAEMINIGGLPLRSISALYRDVLINKGQINGNNTDLNILIYESELNKYIVNKHSELKNFQIQLIPEQVYLSGDLKIFESKIKIRLSGKFAITKPDKISFVPENIKIEKLQIPGSVIKNFTNQLGFSFDLANLNLPLKVEKIKVSEKELHLLGGVSVRKAGL